MKMGTDVPIRPLSTQRLRCSCVSENSIVAFGNVSDERTGAARPAMPSPATDSHSANMATTAQGVSMETEQNILRAQIPTQVRRDGNAMYKLSQTQRWRRTQKWVTPLQMTWGVCFSRQEAADGWEKVGHMTI